ncbi:MAG: hypothetical protein ACW99A_07415 [Candidatus Kariarchaeaceae archaeon]
MSLGKYRLLTILCIILLGFQSSTQQVAGNQLRLPQQNVHNDTLFGGPGNDILIESRPEYGILDHDFLVESGSTDHVYTNDENRVQFSSGPSTSPFEIFNHEGFNHFVNNSADELAMNFETSFFDFLFLDGEDVNNTNLVENVLLFDEEFYGFTFHVTEEQVMEPLVIASAAQTPFNPFAMDLHILAPSGQIQTSRANFPPSIDTLFPIVPFESGPHTVFLEPRSGDVVLEHFAILNNFPVESIENGCVKTYQGTRADVEFIRPDLSGIDPRLLTTDEFIGTNSVLPFTFDTNAQPTGIPYDPTLRDYPGTLDVNGYSRQDPIVQDTDQPWELGGAATIRVHRPDAPFGLTIPQSDLHMGDTIISTTLIPPNDSNPSVKRAKEDLGLSEGYDIEVGIWFEFDLLDTLPVGKDFLLRSDSTDFNYQLEVESDKIIAFNDSKTGDSGTIFTYATFTNIDTEETLTVNAQNNNILNYEDIRLDILPAGNYTVRITGDQNSFARCSLLDFEPFGTTQTVDQHIGDHSFFSLPTSGFVFDGFNVTYLDELNRSASFSIFIYDSSGNYVNDHTFDFDNYANETDLLHQININDTVAGGVNFKGGFIQIFHTGNDVWNSSMAIPTKLASDLLDISSRLRIERIDYLDLFRKANPDQEYFEANLDSAGRDLNTTKTEIMGYLNYRSDVGGNRIVFTSMNMSLGAQLLVDGGGLPWITQGSSLSVVDGISFYTVILEFATTVPVDFIIILDFDPSGSLNGTLSVEKTEVTEIYQLPEVILRTLAFTNVGSDGDIPKEIVTAGSGKEPIPRSTTIGVIIVITAVGGGIYVIQSRSRRVRPE